MSLPSEFFGAWRRVGLGRDGYVRIESAGLAVEVSAAAGSFSAVKYQSQGGSWVETGRVDTNV
jgi:hypothetical protein